MGYVITKPRMTRYGMPPRVRRKFIRLLKRWLAHGAVVACVGMARHALSGRVSGAVGVESTCGHHVGEILVGSIGRRRISADCAGCCSKVHMRVEEDYSCYWFVCNQCILG
ncbi:hypothetical protein T440DRAFT_156036 [Plenodomus tracheiphilus IPT5]|uniref:Uncharacterized protein n=1 Tax=Plenodomus tracheiphilus IPT5 TaxID=1408161 RepID=A0A6A7BL25_9PLEO|nr:hypothetical protein T440DRAFT_156036 [Plenodomus tracheiphilus IPT5]